MPENTIQFIPQRRFYDTATVAETHRRLLAEGHKHTVVYIRLSSLQELLTSVSGKVWTDSATGKLLRENGLVEVGKDGHTAKAKFPQLGRFVPINKENLEKQAKI